MRKIYSNLKLIKQSFYILTLIFLSHEVSSQMSKMNGKDKIVKTNGSIIKGNVKNTNDNEITYKKFFRKYSIDSDKVLFIMNSNGTTTEINDITMAKNYQNYSFNASTKLSLLDDSIKSKFGNFKPHYVERIGTSFRIDTSRVISLGKMNDLIEQSPNPVVQINLKQAKLMRTLTTITKIMQYPSSASGAFASYKTFTDLFNQMKQGPVPFKYYLNSGLSFLATISLPITGAILNSVKRKKYDKTLNYYSQF